MKPIHKQKTFKNQIRKFPNYLYIANGFGYITNAHSAQKLPLSTLGLDCISNEEEFYIHLDFWKNNKFAKAAVIERDGNTLRAYSLKNEVIGEITLKTQSEVDFKFPDVEVVLPKEDNEIEYEIGLNAELLKSITDVLSTEGDVRLKFIGKNKPIIVESISNPEQSINLLMPIRLKD